jgi:hypothetical protein
MSSKPKKQGPTAADKASASVAMAEYNRFKQKYDPLLRNMRDESLTEDTTSTLRARSNADTMQALTSQPNFQQTQNVTAGSDMAQALQGQLGQATKAGKQIQNTMQTNVLGVARGQAADAQRGMSQAARLSTSEALTRAKAKQDVAQAKINAGVQIGSALVAQGGKNLAGGGTFFTPNIGGQLPTDGSGDTTPTRRLATGFSERAQGGVFRR